MNQTRKVTEGAMMIAIIGVLLFINRQSAGLIDFALFWLIPLPIVIYINRYSFKDAIPVAISGVLLAFVAGMPTGLYYTFVGVILGLIYGYATKKGIESQFLLLIAIGISLLSTVLTVFVFGSVFGYNIANEVVEMQELSNQYLEQLNAMMPMEGSQIVLLDSMLDFLPKLVIISTVISAILEGLTIHLLTYLVMIRLKMPIKKMRNIATIQLPKPLGYLLAFAYILGNIQLARNVVNVSSDLVYLVLLLSAMILIANGYLAIITILAYKRKQKLAWLLIFSLIPPFIYVVAIIGYLDSTANFRFNHLK